MSDVVNDSVQCPCGYIFHGDDLDQESGKRKPCPKCGSLKRIFNEELTNGFVAGDSPGGVHEAHMNPQSWTILGLIVGLLLPPIYYAVYEILSISFWYKLLIWLSIIITPFLLACRCRIIWHGIIMSLRWMADKAYGKRKI